MIKESIGQRVHRLRKESGLSLMELGRMSHVSDNALVHLEKGRHLPRIDTAIQIAQALGVSLEYLACLTDTDVSVL